MLKFAVIIVTIAALAACGPSSVQIATRKLDELNAAKARTSRQDISKAEEKAAHDMLDPNSVQFRNVSIRGENVCGELNAKNSFGAYTGFRSFESS